MNSNVTNILLRNNYIPIPLCGDKTNEVVSCEAIATVMMNLSYYGFALSTEGYSALRELSNTELASWWQGIESELKEITGESRKIGDFVVYKNFPAEVLSKSDAEYWIPQILMYWGVPNSFFTESVQPREKLNEQPKAKVLACSKPSTLHEIWDALLRSPARWKEQDFQDVIFLLTKFPVSFEKLTFKENMVRLAAFMAESGQKVSVDTATDVLRLAAGLSDGDVSLREKVKFKSFKKPMRRFLLSILEDCKNLAEDFARREELWKRLLHNLHPGDYRKRFPRVCEVMDDLYNGRLVTFNSKVEALLKDKDPSVLALLATRPGDFRRRLVHTLELFGDKAVEAFTSKGVIDGLTTFQVVALRRYLDTLNERYHRCFPPKGNWSRLQIGEARWIEERYLSTISKALGQALSTRIPAVKFLDEATKLVKLPSNGEDGPYTRGTAFPIPEGTDFIRTASYWSVNNSRYTWYDNGWNFFDSNWNPLGSCCWSSPFFPRDYSRGWGWERTQTKDTGAVFSGDPTIASGKAAQMIDLYPAQLRAAGVRYAVWSILCYSRLTFSEAEDVFAAFQWGKDANKGKLFEPSRCQLAIPLKGDTYTKYVVLIDLESNQMIYLDASLKANTNSADSNGLLLQTSMPAFMEYINSLPSVHDLFRESVSENGEALVLYSDKDVRLTGNPAYVFRPENQDNKFQPVNINALLQ